jgi:hypothetical protein
MTSRTRIVKPLLHIAAISSAGVLAISCAAAGANLIGVAHAGPYSGTKGHQDGTAYANDISKYVPDETAASALKLAQTI